MFDAYFAWQLVQLIVLLSLIGYLLVYLLRGAPYLPSPASAVDQMVSAADVQPGEKAVDLGSGDGRIVIALAQAGAEAHGFEVNPILVWLSRRKIRAAGLEGKAFIHRKSFWRVSFTGYHVVTVFGITHIMKELETKLRRELPRGARVVSNGFHFPTWTAEEREPGISVYRQT